MFGRENEIHISKPPCIVFFDFIGNVFSLYIGKLTFCTNNSEKAGNDVINILNSEGLKNTPLGTRVEFLMNFFVEWYIFQ